MEFRHTSHAERPKLRPIPVALATTDFTRRGTTLGRLVVPLVRSRTNGSLEIDGLVGRANSSAKLKLPTKSFVGLAMQSPRAQTPASMASVTAWAMSESSCSDVTTMACTWSCSSMSWSSVRVAAALAGAAVHCAAKVRNSTADIGPSGTAYATMSPGEMPLARRFPGPRTKAASAPYVQATACAPEPATVVASASAAPRMANCSGGCRSSISKIEASALANQSWHLAHCTLVLVPWILSSPSPVFSPCNAAG
mmetsp:Transcript_122831/g.306801  ORF Transcript_122831/g.306801 Transcript_122831/m.306801 type:complete len:253 (+) Transcript_122831:221-979(+)